MAIKLVGTNWTSIIQGAILFLGIGGAFWALAYNPIQHDILEIKTQINDLRNYVYSSDEKLRREIKEHEDKDAGRYLTDKEHTEYKHKTDGDIRKIFDALETIRKETEQRRYDLESKVEREADSLRKEIENRRVEVATKTEMQATTSATRIELLAEIKRLDQRVDGDMKRAEFEVWKSERDKTIGAISERLNRFSEALDAMYARVMQQMPSYKQRSNE